MAHYVIIMRSMKVPTGMKFAPSISNSHGQFPECPNYFLLARFRIKIGLKSQDDSLFMDSEQKSLFRWLVAKSKLVGKHALHNSASSCKVIFGPKLSFSFS